MNRRISPVCPLTGDAETAALALANKKDDRLRKEFGLKEEDLNLDLGPLGRLL